ncbi:Pentatricopeptide repeat-containing protein [Nymphaea thermarum]|nr:Pentatricopeptide repeat-containing protein [Nymphaea thermarum]
MVDASYLSNLLRQAVLSRSLTSGEKLHTQIIKGGFQFDLFLSNNLISLYIRSPATLRCANKVFDEIRDPDVVSWTTLISGYAHAYLPLRALDLFVSMLRHSTLPNQHTFSAIFHACAEISAAKPGLQIHAQAVKLGLDRQKFVSSSVMDMYAKCGRVDDGLQVFDGMPERDEVSWGGIICCCSQNGRPWDALQLFGLMHASDAKANMFSLSGALCASADAAAYDQGRTIHAYALAIGLETNVFVGSALVDMYGKCGVINDAQAAFDSMAAPNLVSWNAIIMAYAQQGNANAALKLFAELRSQGVFPDDVTFLAILTACSNAGMVDDARNCLTSMSTEFGLPPTVGHYTCVISVLCRVGLIEEAEELALVMPFPPDRAVWRVLLSACMLHGNSVVGERVGRRAIESRDKDGENEEDASLYVLLCNIYSGKARWHEAGRIRRELHELRVQKEAGQSWIGIAQHLHVFVSGDQTHPFTVDIYRVIAVLTEEIKKLMIY